MRRKLYWSLALGLVGALLAEKGTYWLSGTYLGDIETLALGLLGGALAGFLLGSIVERPTDERHRRLKIVYWLAVMAILGLYLGIGRRVPSTTTAVVLACTLGAGLLAGMLQYLVQSPTSTR